MGHASGEGGGTVDNVDRLQPAPLHLHAEAGAVSQRGEGLIRAIHEGTSCTQ
jgi:hypothetical protein